MNFIVSDPTHILEQTLPNLITAIHCTLISHCFSQMSQIPGLAS